MAAALTTDNVVAVIGAGTMGAGIAQVAAAAGHNVLLYDAMQGAADAGLARTLKGLQRQVERGRMTAETLQQITSRMQAVNDLESLADAKLVVEAIIENLEIKQNLFQQLESICSNDTIFASNTSSLSITSIAAALERPEQLVGMHFFNPAPVMKLVEVISGIATDCRVADTVFATATAWGKRAVHAKSTPGFIVNRVARPYYAEALRILQEGASSVVNIDTLLRQSAQFRMGPFELMDLIGHDVNYAVTSSVFNAYYQDPRFTPSLIQQELVNAKRLGRKSGHGFYRYDEDAAKPNATFATAGDAPETITYRFASSLLQPLAERIESSELTAHATDTVESDDAIIAFGDVAIRLCDGRTATQIASETGQDNTLLFDLALDYANTPVLGLARADQCSDDALNQAAGLFKALGIDTIVLDDVPGMCVMRTVCMLANEGADAVNQQVCDAAAVDIAMQNGVNYPKGPLAWADQIGIEHVNRVLQHLAESYGEDRYRVSPLLRRLNFSGAPFHD